MKKFACILLTFAMAAVLFACAKEAEKPAESASEEATASTAEVLNYTVDYEDYNHLTQTVIAGIDIDPEKKPYLYLCSVPTVNRNEKPTKPVYVVPEGVTDSQLIHWPNIPVVGTEPFQVAACAEMSKNPRFDGAKIIKDQYLQLGEIGGEPCVRVHLDTDKGDFVAVMTEQCEVLFVWEEGEEKTVQYYFPQAWDATVASDEDLMIAFNVFHGDEHYKNEIICEYIQERADFADGSTAHKVTFIATGGDFSVLIDEYGRVIERTK